MSDSRLTDKTLLNETPANGDLFHVVDVSDTTGNISGTSKKVTRQNLVGGLLDSTTFNNHSARHEDGGADQISVAGLSGLLADAQTPTSHDNSAHSEDFATVDGTETLTNKRIDSRQDSSASSSDITPNKANFDEHYRTAQAAAITINNATSPSVGDTFAIYLTDNATARAITFGAHYTGIDGQVLPTTTTISKTMEIIIKYVTATKALVSYVEEE